MSITITEVSPIYILSGPVRSGKTTRLEKWVQAQANIDGILAPVIDEKRCLRHIASAETKLLEKRNCSEADQLIRIGRHTFSEEVFTWAREKLCLCMETKRDWLIIDEIGPLELDGMGLEPVVSQILSARKQFPDLKIVLVVRESLKDKMLRHYSIPALNYRNFNL